MNEDESKQDRGFTVVDKRGAGESEAASGPETEETTGNLPRVDFSNFCLSLATSALYQLGVVGDPETGKPVEQKNLPLAQQTIDALEMLQSRTRGNLDAEETQFLDGLLYELRMRFLEAGKAAAE
ncbi:MAG: DUF1844 domain-containing protein [Deltaproteobacteria bacterium]|nr:DUF1844 domain-containing protein [Deltaproteobacteria bacterium]MBW2360197.1 DUF1844 domain-containing protein [Deltaproteobacteria bacterium]